MFVLRQLLSVPQFARVHILQSFLGTAPRVDLPGWIPLATSKKQSRRHSERILRPTIFDTHTCD
jgi:hypothetical protein